MNAEAHMDDSQSSTGVHEPGAVPDDADPSLLGSLGEELMAQPEEPIPPPRFDQIAEFQIGEKLGQGGFGAVYSAFDTQLERFVAIKIPHQATADTTPYLQEARAAAGLQHPHILPVFRVGSTKEVPFYIVTQLIEGTTLGVWHQRHRPTYPQVAEMMAKITEALAFAHSKHIVHRDVKPGNILVDLKGHPYLADFGLATREFEPDSKTAYAGTPAYMSPEQKRGEGHLVGGRSDIYSLGVVLYQLLVGCRPFENVVQQQSARSQPVLEPEHPCRLNPAVPRELARICLRALEESFAKRYQIAGEMAIDLYEFVKSHGGIVDDAKLHTRVLTDSGSDSDGAKPSATEVTVIGHPQSETRVAPVVPKGLRSFESRDSEFFLRLLPGPYDRDGLPDSIRFWKTRLESKLPQEAFSVGVVYGPSGCGKTSMVRAGLLPHLSDDLIPIYLEASAGDMERAILDAINSAEGIPPRPPKPDSGEDGAGAELLAAFKWLRRHSRRKVVICIDQFEQWLYSHSSTLESSPLTQALRQCDGVHLQVLLLVRDDFWMGLTRLMQALDLAISEHQNARAVDLFDKRHARHVLALFGAAFGQLPSDEHLLTPSQNDFLSAAVESLAIDGRVICVQLALLAEMIKHRPWGDMTLLSQDGGVGLGLHFLEQTFDLETSHKRHRRHTEGAHRVLRRLLPEPGVKIKGAIQSESELLSASGYTNPADFKELIKLLDAELHLITMSDGSNSDHVSVSGASPLPVSDPGYQLTHDFLIASIRRWLELRQLGSKVGQAQVKLESFTDLYRARPSHHSLPSLIEYLMIRYRLRPTSWNEPQTRMMTAARQRHLHSVGQWAAIVLMGAVIGILGWQWNVRLQERQRVVSQVERLVVANWPEAITQASALRPGDPFLWETLRSHFNDPKSPISQRARAALVLSPTDPAARDLLLDYLQEAPPRDVVQLSRSGTMPELVDLEKVRGLWQAQPGNPAHALRLACLLAQQPTTQPLLREDPQRIVQLLVKENPLYLTSWMDGMAPLRESLVPTLVSTHAGLATESSSAALNSANLLARYADRRPDLLAELLSQSGPTGYRIFVEALRGNAAGRKVLWDALQATRLPKTPDQYWLPDAEGIDWWNDDLEVEITPPAPLADTPRLMQQIEDAGGLATESFVLAQRLGTPAFESLTASLAPYGYRVASICPYVVGGQRLCMATWKRDGRQSVYTLQATADELKQLQAEYDMEEQDYFAEDLVAYSLDDHETAVFACVWTTTPPLPNVVATRMYVDVPAEKNEEEGWGPLLKLGFFPRCNILTRNRQKREAHTSIRWKAKEWINNKDDWNQPRDAFDKTVQWSPATLLVHGQLGERSPDDPARGLSALWWSGLPLESRWLPYQSLPDHRRACATAEANGYRPFSIHATQTAGDDTPLYSSTWWRPLENLVTRTDTIRRQTRLILALHELGDPAEVQAALSSLTDAEQRGSVVDGFSRYEVPPLWLAEQLVRADDLVLRRAASHALALYRPGPQRELAQNWLQAQGPSSLSAIEDAGLRSGVLALARAWSLPPPQWTAKVTAHELLTSENQRMVILTPPAVQWIGSLANEPGRDGNDEIRYPVLLKHRFAISTHEVTVQEYLNYRADASIQEDYSPTSDCPIVDLNWFEATRYCRWLSHKEGIPESEMCYPVIDEKATSLRLVANWMNLTGYRLLTEAEWEFAAHGGYAEGRHFGFAPELLDHYAWTAQNSGYRCHPVGTRLPNDYGLFDLFGNAMEWCHTQDKGHPWPSSGVEQDPGSSSQEVDAEDRMETRGAAQLFQPLDARASHRNSHLAEEGRVYLSFRIARTIRE